MLSYLPNRPVTFVRRFSDDPVSTISSSLTVLHVDPVEELSNTQRKRKHISTESGDFFNSQEVQDCGYVSVFKPGHLCSPQPVQH